MLESFTGDNVAEFDATGPGDDDQAALESFAVTKAVMKDNNGYQNVGTATKDALLLRNGWTKVYVEEKVAVETQNLENVVPDTIAAFREQPGLEVEVPAYDAEAKTDDAPIFKNDAKVSVRGNRLREYLLSETVALYRNARNSVHCRTPYRAAFKIARPGLSKGESHAA